jgi:hypothetical protein
MVLTENEIECLKNTNFIKLSYSHNENLFSSLLVDMSINNEAFSISSCEEITKYIDDIGYNSDSEFIKLVKSLLPILNINDEFQLLRFNFIIGYPTLCVDDPNLRSKWPLIGFHKLSESTSKFIEFKSSQNLRGNSSILRKLVQLRNAKDKLAVEIFLILLDACQTNFALLKYLKMIPSDEINWEE